MQTVEAAPAMRTVRAARIHDYAGAEAVRVEKASLPDPQEGELLIRVHAAGVNPIDRKIRAGYLQQMTHLPLTLGGDFSGEVEAVGAAVAGFQVGDEVYGQAGVLTGGSGSFAESCLARAGSTAARPRSVTHTQAGALPLAGDTYERSFQVLKRGGRLVSMLQPPRQALMKDFGVEGFAQSTQVTTERLTKLADLVDQGALRVQVDKTFPLEQAGAALLYLEKESPRGKVVLEIV